VGEFRVADRATSSEPAQPDFHDFVQRRSGGLLRTAWLLTGDRGLAEDLLQTALAATWSRRDNLRHDDALEAYVRKAMLNTLTSWRRRRSFHEIPTHDLPDAADTARDGGETRVELLKAIAKLPLKQRAVIALRYLEDLSEAATAHALGCSVGTVKSHTSRALRALSQHSALRALIETEEHR
jgi:RNA polymerase sigma-70 factor (sigma-E family)